MNRAASVLLASSTLSGPLSDCHRRLPLLVARLRSCVRLEPAYECTFICASAARVALSYALMMLRASSMLFSSEALTLVSVTLWVASSAATALMICCWLLAPK
jgi:hypothetical protein